MARCQHCKRLTHSEHLIVYYDREDHEKVYELVALENWIPVYQYHRDDPHISLDEYCKLECGDIHIHFRIKKPNEGKSANG